MGELLLEIWYNKVYCGKSYRVAVLFNRSFNVESPPLLPSQRDNLPMPGWSKQAAAFMGYLPLLADLSWQTSAVPNSRQGYSGCRISIFPDGGKERCLHDKGAAREESWLERFTRQLIDGKDRLRPVGQSR